MSFPKDLLKGREQKILVSRRSIEKMEAGIPLSRRMSGLDSDWFDDNEESMERIRKQIADLEGIIIRLKAKDT